jgi:hypothetical protein
MFNLPPLPKPRSENAPRWFHVAVAISMVLSAVSALVAALNTSRTMNALVEQNARMVRASATPLLEFGHGNLDEQGKQALSFNLRNVGHGPARIVWFELRLDGKPQPDMATAIRALQPGLAKEPLLNTGPVAPRMFASGADQRFFYWPRPDKAEPGLIQAWDTLNQARFKRLEVEACYCSVFEECWTSKLVGDVPQPVAACKPVSTSLSG